MKETLFEKASFLYFFKEKKGQMVKAKAPRIVASRTLDSMRRANAKANVRLGEKVRSKCAPRKLAASKKRCAQVKAVRKKFSSEMKFIVAAREYAQDCSRRTLRELKGAKPRAQKEKGKAPGARPRHRTSAARAMRPSNFDLLLAQVPRTERNQRPTAAGQRIIYVEPRPGNQYAWHHGVVAHLSRHNVEPPANWVFVRKRTPIAKDENPFLVIDSPNTLLLPSVPLVNANDRAERGVYVLYNGVRQEFYVGESDNIGQRLVAHSSGTGAAWTQRWAGNFERLKPRTTPKRCLQAWEAQEVAALMKLFGRNKVRGGAFTCSQER